MSQRAASVRLQVAVGRDRPANAIRRRGAGAAEATATSGHRPSGGPPGRAAAAELRRRAATAARRRRRARAASARACPHREPWMRTAADPARAPGSPTPRPRRPEAALVGQPGTVRRVVPQRLHERLIRRDALLVGAPIEHDAALGMRPRGDPRRQARLADARLADQRHHAALAARDLLPERVQRGAAVPRGRQTAAARAAPAPGAAAPDAVATARIWNRLSAAKARPPGSHRAPPPSAARSRSCRARTRASRRLALLDAPPHRHSIRATRSTRRHARRLPERAPAACALGRRGYHVVAASRILTST